MKTIKFQAVLFAILGLVAMSCKKDKAPDPAPEIISFSLTPAGNPGLTGPVEGIIEGKTISLRVPNSMDITKAVPSFEVSATNAIVYVGGTVQQSGSTELDLSAPVNYRVVSESGSTEYTVNALRNAAIISFGFYAEDNEGVLFRDYEGEISGLNIEVSLPVDAPLDALVARYTTTAGASVAVGGTTQESQVTANNFTSAVTYTVSDAQSEAPDQFVVTVGRLTAPEWVSVPTTGLAETTTGIRLALHPVTHAPYVVYRIPNSVAETTEDRKIAAAYLDGATWKQMGAASGFSTNRVDLVDITIDTDGVVYAAYKDFDPDEAFVQGATVMKYADNNWTVVGSRQFTEHRVNHLSIAVGDDKQPVIGYVLARADGGLLNRAPHAVQWSNNSWVARPIPGVSTAFFARTFTGNDGKVYYAAMDMTPGTAERRPTLLQLNNGTWQTVGSPLITPHEDVFGAILIDGAVADDGTAYLVFQSQPNADKMSYVMRYNGSTWEQIGAEIPHTAGSNGERDNIALAVHPNGTLFFAHADATGLYVTTFNEETNNWNQTVTLSSERVDGLDMKITADGVPYLLTTGLDDSKPMLYKFDIPN